MKGQKERLQKCMELMDVEVQIVPNEDVKRIVTLPEIHRSSQHLQPNEKFELERIEIDKFDTFLVEKSKSRIHIDSIGYIKSRHGFQVLRSGLVEVTKLSEL